MLEMPTQLLGLPSCELWITVLVVPHNSALLDLDFGAVGLDGIRLHDVFDRVNPGEISDFKESLPCFIIGIL